MIGDLDHATFSNIEHQEISYLQRSLVPWLVRIEQALTVGLMSEAERKELIIEFDTANFLRGDTISRYQAYAIGIQNGILAPNEVRAMENRNPMEGGDSIMLPLNMAQASEVQKDDVKEAEGDGARNVTSLFQRSSGRRAAFRGEDAAIRNMTEGFGRWIGIQEKELIHILKQRGKKNSVEKRSEALEKKITEYYDVLRKDMKEDAQSGAWPEGWGQVIESMEEIAEQKWSELSKGKKSKQPKEVWKDEFIRRYRISAADRLCSANCEGIINGIKESYETEEAVKKCFSRWKDGDREVFEKNLLINEIKIAWNREGGYYSNWKAGANCCRVCKSLDGARITNLTPPLHKGCECTVEQGSVIRTERELEELGSDKEIFEDANFVTGEKQVEHVLKHAEDTGSKDSRDYLKRARELLQSSGSDDIIISRNRNVVVKFCRSTGFYVKSMNYSIVTFFKPRNGEVYYENNKA